jgi:hypothetical protein
VFHEDHYNKPYAFETVEPIRQYICSLAWTWLSPHIEFWDLFFRGELGKEVCGDPNVDREETANKLRNMPPQTRFVKTTTSIYCQGKNPLQFRLNRLDKTTGLAPTVSLRVLGSLVEKAQDPFWMKGADQDSRQALREETEAARKQLTGAAQVRDEFMTTDIFAVAAQQLMWAVEAGLKLRDCLHPGCGTAFLVKPEDYRCRYCPEHRGVTARAARYRDKGKNERND